MIFDNEDFEVKSSNSYWAGRLIDLPKDDAWEIATEIAETIEYALRQANGVSTKHGALPIADVGGSLRELADKYEKDALERYEKGNHALSHLHMAAQARYGFEDGWKAAKKQ